MVASEHILPTPTSLEDSVTTKPQAGGTRTAKMFTSSLATVPIAVGTDLITPQSLPTAPSSSCINLFNSLMETLFYLLCIVKRRRIDSGLSSVSSTSGQKSFKVPPRKPPTAASRKPFETKEMLEARLKIHSTTWHERKDKSIPLPSTTFDAKALRLRFSKCNLVDVQVNKDVSELIAQSLKFQVTDDEICSMQKGRFSPIDRAHYIDTFIVLVIRFLFSGIV